MELADHLLRTHSDLDPKLARTALLIMGHGQFELGQFAAAEAWYRQLLALPDVGESNAPIEEKLLAAIYKQAEAAEAAGAVDEAVNHYLRIAQQAPGSELAAKGHFDAVAAIEGQGRWAEAATLLADFRATYAGNALLVDAPKRLADLYEKAGDVGMAATELRGIAGTDKDPEIRRQALYRAGEMYLEIDKLSEAIAAFTDYANTYPNPVELSLEAMQHLDLLYQRIQSDRDRRVWLARKVELADRQGGAATDRMKFLAAEAQYVFATDARVEFDAIALTNPLKKSLQQKTAALKKTVAAYEKVSGYGVAQFATAANFQIADLYAALSHSVLESARPAGLSDLELEQYEILLEEQAFPFEEQAIALHEINAQRSWTGIYDEWVQKSFSALKTLNPGRFDREEVEVTYVHSIY
jgi:tetratricopeptide (TPR) repeat protein